MLILKKSRAIHTRSHSENRSESTVIAYAKDIEQLLNYFQDRD